MYVKTNIISFSLLEYEHVNTIIKDLPMWFQDPWEHLTYVKIVSSSNIANDSLK